MKNASKVARPALRKFVTVIVMASAATASCSYVPSKGTSSTAAEKTELAAPLPEAILQVGLPSDEQLTSAGLDPSDIDGYAVAVTPNDCDKGTAIDKTLLRTSMPFTFVKLQGSCNFTFKILLGSVKADDATIPNLAPSSTSNNSIHSDHDELVCKDGHCSIKPLNPAAVPSNATLIAGATNTAYSLERTILQAVSSLDLRGTNRNVRLVNAIFAGEINSKKQSIAVNISAYSAPKSDDLIVTGELKTLAVAPAKVTATPKPAAPAVAPSAPAALLRANLLIGPSCTNCKVVEREIGLDPANLPAVTVYGHCKVYFVQQGTPLYTSETLAIESYLASKKLSWSVLPGLSIYKSKALVDAAGDLAPVSALLKKHCKK